MVTNCVSCFCSLPFHFVISSCNVAAVTSLRLVLLFVTGNTRLTTESLFSSLQVNYGTLFIVCGEEWIYDTDVMLFMQLDLY